MPDFTDAVKGILTELQQACQMAQTAKAQHPEMTGEMLIPVHPDFFADLQAGCPDIPDGIRLDLDHPDHVTIKQHFSGNGLEGTVVLKVDSTQQWLGSVITW